ncbi:acyl-coenzyme A thioesterase 13-like [Glandiceps talaboti]
MAGNNSVKVAQQFLKTWFGNGRNFERHIEKVSVIAAEPGRVKFEMLVSEEHTNKGGTLHGGMTATLVAFLHATALVTKIGQPGVAVDLNVTYVNAAQIGTMLSIDAKVLKVGKTLGFMASDITNESGDLIAQRK